MKNSNYKVRFNLSKGKNYLHWKIQSSNETIYLSPDKIQLSFNNCLLKNYKRTAEAIYQGKHKSVCAWLFCENYEVVDEVDVSSFERLYYNPKINPHWMFRGSNVDEASFDEIISFENKLFVK